MADKKTNKGKGKKSGRNVLLWSCVVLMIIGSAAYICGSYMLHRYRGAETWLYVPQGTTEYQLRDLLTSRLGADEGSRVYNIWKFREADPDKAHGAYLIKPGDRSLNIARRLRSGLQSPKRAMWHDARTLRQVAERVTADLECTPEQFLMACDSILPAEGFDKAEMPAAFLPDTYEFYWSVKPADLVRRLLGYRNDFWTPERVEKASDMGLTPVQVAIVASIVEEETAKNDERPLVARLYLNRLEKGMKLQADPTVKFAVGDASIRRITSRHLSTPSPYNTYLHAGLPPGPIRVVDRRTLDAVLNAPHHDNLYMCAKEDFSGYHNFAKDYATHQANARRYQAELNRRGIR